MAHSVRKEKRRSQIRQEVISTAEKLVKDEGLEALTIRRLADLLNYSPAALYEYFASKEQVIAALRQNIFKRQLEQLQNIDSQLPPDVYFESICLEMLRFRLKPENNQIMFLKLSEKSLQQLSDSNDLIELRQIIDSSLQKLNLPHLTTTSERQIAILTLRSYLEGIVHLTLREELPEGLKNPEEITKKVIRFLGLIES